MASPGLPWAVAELSIVDLCQAEAAPLAAPRQAGGALAGELEGQRHLLPLLVTEDMRTKLAVAPLVGAGDLFAAEDCLAEQLVSRAWHGPPLCEISWRFDVGFR